MRDHITQAGILIVIQQQEQAGRILGGFPVLGLAVVSDVKKAVCAAQAYAI